jgi:hypothetical protein
MLRWLGGSWEYITGSGGVEMYYGLYYKYGVYAWAALLGGLVVIYKMVIAITEREAWPQKIIVIFILLLLAFIISGYGYAKDRYEQIKARSEREFQVVSGEADVEGALSR